MSKRTSKHLQQQLREVGNMHQAHLLPGSLPEDNRLCSTDSCEKPLYEEIRTRNRQQTCKHLTNELHPDWMLCGTVRTYLPCTTHVRHAGVHQYLPWGGHLALGKHINMYWRGRCTTPETEHHEVKTLPMHDVRT